MLLADDLVQRAGGLERLMVQSRALAGVGLFQVHLLRDYSSRSAAVKIGAGGHHIRVLSQRDCQNLTRAVRERQFPPRRYFFD